MNNPLLCVTIESEEGGVPCIRSVSYTHLVLYGRRIVAFVQEQKNMTEEIMRYTTAFYGYKTLEDAEQSQK